MNGPAIQAEWVALAVVAAARTHGDDPMAAAGLRTGVHRRSASAAALGLHYATNAPITLTARLLGLQPSTIERARSKCAEPFAKAAEAAELAVMAAMGLRRRLPITPLTLDDRILTALRLKSQSAPQLATILGEKEIGVTLQLAALAHAGDVAADGEGRHRLWRLAGS